MSTFTSKASRLRLWHVGSALILLGGAMLVGGLTERAEAAGNEACPVDTELVAKFEYSGGRYVFEGPVGNAGIVQISPDATATGGTWDSSMPIAAVIVKGGTGATITEYSPAAASGTFSNVGLPLVGDGNLPEISNVEFCGPTEPEPYPTYPTTTEAATTTTEAATTTTEAATTTTQAATTTTQAATTTTQAATTTTQATTTTTQATTTTTTALASAGPTTTQAATTTTGAVLGSSGTLPATGSSPQGLLVTGALLTLLGFVMVIVGRVRGRALS